MSTAGKVLVVLVTLSLMAWIVLFSAVAQFNTNWGQKLLAQEKQISKTRGEIEQALAQIAKNQDETTAFQVKLRNDLIVLRSNLSDAEKVLSESVETNSRYLIDLQTVEGHAKSAKASLARRETELAEAKKQLADEQAVVKRYQGENDALLAQFSKLQKDFLDTMAANRKLAREAAKGASGETARGNRRQASFVP